MPLQTFLNLPEERQKEIVNVCLEEFAHRDFKSASLAKIIKTLNLAKGSFYRYFENKKDLYHYLIAVTRGFGERYAEDFKQSEGKDFFDAWADFYLSVLEVEKEYPFYVRFAFRVSIEQDPEIHAFVRKRRKRRHDILTKVIKAHQKAGHLRKDIEVEVLILILRNVQRSFQEYLAGKYHLDLKRDSESDSPVFPLPEKTLRSELESFIDVMRHGMVYKIKED